MQEQDTFRLIERPKDAAMALLVLIVLATVFL